MRQNHDSSFNALKERRVGTDALSQKIDYESATYLLAVRPWSSYLTVSESLLHVQNGKKAPTHMSVEA